MNGHRASLQLRSQVLDENPNDGIVQRLVFLFSHLKIPPGFFKSFLPYVQLREHRKTHGAEEGLAIIADQCQNALIGSPLFLSSFWRSILPGDREPAFN